MGVTIYEVTKTGTVGYAMNTQRIANVPEFASKDKIRGVLSRASSEVRYKDIAA